ncbi:hypothetical protein COHA_002607 [Chlorella ohadii]|uniref:non-specific serine/threonine protein kinase n=1 Tax=Chlorella ohadii TaxID=2649997 RepID=A0AAD5H7E0_9CHLO|nr:hypothetical protein COHA_002607 [Chlorella ohadii]
MAALTPLVVGPAARPRAAAAARGPASPSGQPAGSLRGALLVARAGASYATEWEMYRAECSFHQLHMQRTLQIMQQLSREFRGEWHTYTAEAAVAAGAAHLRSPAAEAAETGTVWRRKKMAKAVVQPAADGTPIVGDIFDDAMRPGGYHPVTVGERFNEGRYTALYKLGQGHYATVWMVLDGHTGQELAMKIVRSADAYTAAARTEVSILEHIRDSAAGTGHTGAQHCVRLMDTFTHTGPHGTHVCEVFEAMGDDLLTLLKEYNFRGIPLAVVKHLTRQTLSALDYLHRTCNIIHTDLKPENVMLTEPLRPRGGHSFAQPPAELDMVGLEPRLLQMGAKVVDFGCGCWTDRQFSEEVQTRQYRAPEVILGAGYDDAADIWSLGCMVFELVTGDLLFHPEARPGQWNEDEDHLAQMMEALQPMPREVATSGKWSANYFTHDGRLRNTMRSLQPMPLDWVLHQRHQLPSEEALALRDFLLPMLNFNPRKRASAAQMLQHPWLAQ